MIVKLGSRRTLGSLVLLVVALAVVGCGGSGSDRGTPAALAGSDGEPVRGGTLTMARTADLFTMDPAAIIDNISIYTALQMYDRLVTLAPDGKSVEPELATSWDFSKGGRVVTFKLREGVKFSDGSPLTAADVVTSLNRERKESPYASLVEPVTDVTEVDPSTVRITMKAPFAPLLPALSSFAFSIHSKAQFEKYGKELGTRPLGTGAFMLEEWKKGSELTLVRNPHYWQEGKPYLDKLVFRIVGDDNARVIQLQSGTVDVIEKLPPNQVEPVKAGGDKAQDVFGGIVLLMLNTAADKGPFADRNARCAVAWSLDREAVARNAYSGIATPATSPLPAGTLFHDANQGTIGFDMEKAKEFLAQSSVPDGFTFSVDLEAGDTAGAVALQIWSAALKEMGITMKINRLEATTVSSRFSSRKYTSRYTQWTNDTPSPDQMMGVLDHKSALDSFFTGYRNLPAYELMVKARAELDDAKAQELYSEIQRLMNEDCSAFIPLVDIPRLYATTEKVVGFEPNVQGKYRFENVYKTN